MLDMHTRLLCVKRSMLDVRLSVVISTAEFVWLHVVNHLVTLITASKNPLPLAVQIE